MNSKPFSHSLAALAAAALLAGCVDLPTSSGLSKASERAAEMTPDAALLYYAGLGRLSAAELGRERSILAAVPPSPYTQVRLALLLGHPRMQQDLGKALAALDGVLKSNDAAALPFHPLARLIADNYQERLKLEGQLERQGAQLKESQRKAAELQEKIDGLADIERTLTPRAKARPDGGRR